MPIEILAPVGGAEQLLAAVRAGADAVYLGAQGFNARRNAENFAEQSLAETVSYCHARGVRVHVTLNTLITDDERPALLDTLRSIAAAGADAVIVQDLAVAALVREVCPTLPMHASTQMAIHNLAGVEQAAKLGFSRVVLARELSLPEIRQICAASPVEIECFVHGALCMSVSGACYLSSMIGERSGNRGLCAQPCRLDFRAGTRDHALSLKDHCHIPQLEELAKAGVVSLKIEGRMKRPEYVAAAVNACRAQLEGRVPDLDALQAVFSRSGFTDGYLKGKRDLSMFGYRTKEDVTAAAGVLGGLAGLYRNERPSVPVSMAFSMRPDAPAALTVSDGTHTVSVEGAVPLPSDREPSRELLERNLQKCGGTPFFVERLSIETEGAIMLPASAQNALRREGLEQLLALRSRITPHPCAEPAVLPAQPTPHPDAPPLRARFADPQQLFDTGGELILPIRAIDKDPTLLERFGDRLIGEIPALVYPGEEPRIREMLCRLREQGLRGAYCENIGAVAMARDAGLQIHGGFCLNLLNSGAMAQMKALGLTDAVVSFELAAKKIRALHSELPFGAVVYGYLPLMKLRACPAQGKNGCGKCDGRPTLTDRLGEPFPLFCHERRYSELLNCVPLYTADKAPLPADFHLCYFTVETRDQAKTVWRDICEGRKPTFRRTNGLYYRDLK